MPIHTENTAVTGSADSGPRSGVSRLLAGMVVSTDLTETRRFYETFLGLDCVRCAPDRMLVRDQHTRAAMDAGDESVFVLDVRHADSIENPQRQLHHWGLTVGSAAEVDRVHAAAKAQKEDLGIRKLFPVSNLHGAHSFYMADRDMNWWEIERRIDGLDNEAFFARGDIGEEGPVKEAPAIDTPPPPVKQGDPIVVSAVLTHGTCEQFVLETSRTFVEQVLGLRCVRHLPPAQVIAGRGGFGIFAIRLPRIAPQQFQNRWIVGVDSAADVKAVSLRAEVAAEPLGLKSTAMSDDGQSCVVQDADGNWWEVIVSATAEYQAMFGRGDVEQHA